MYTVRSKNGIAIRLTGERWSHIVEEHCEMAGMLYEILEAVAEPEVVRAGNCGECLAVKKSSGGRYVVVVYKEDADASDGFVITAFITSRTKSLDRRKQIWP